MNDKSLLILLDTTQGNPGACDVLLQICSFYADDLPSYHLAICFFNALNLKGAAIWMLYKDECESNIETLIKTLLERVEAKMLNVTAST